MTDQDHDDEVDDDPRVAELLREIALVAANPTEDGVERLQALLSDTSAMVRVRTAATLLDIGYGPAGEGEPLDEDEP